jgi:cytochrome P450
LASTVFEAGGPGLHERAFYAHDPYPALARLQEEAPVFWYEPGNFWALTRHEDICRVHADPATFSCQYGIAMFDNFNVEDRLRASSPELAATVDAETHQRHELRRLLKNHNEGPNTMNMMLADPPIHPRIRRIGSGRFTRSGVRRLEERIREITRATVNAIPTGEPVDAVTAFAAPVPLEVIAELLGLPDSDRADFARWAEAVIELFDAQEPTRVSQLRDEIADMRNYLADQLMWRESNPQEDLLTDLAHAEIEGSPMPLSAQVRFAVLMLVGGNETTRNLVSNGLVALVQHPSELDRLRRDPSGLLETAVDELLRWTSPVIALSRTATQAVEIRGQQIAAGDYVTMIYPAGNRDPRAWEGADRLDLSRRPSPMHLAFGFGNHVCLGQHLARLEARVMFEELFARFSDIRLDGQPVVTASTHVSGLSSLPVVFA